MSGGISRLRPYVLRLADCTPQLGDRVGGKAVGLGRLLRLGHDVPRGFVITTDAYRKWIAEEGLEPELERLLDGATDAAAEDEASQAIRALFERAGPDGELAAEVGPAYSWLGEGAAAAVAVRSSATAEDTTTASFAGQQDTYLGVVGLDAVMRSVVHCWAGLFTPQAISYRRRLGVPPEQVAMAVLVQRMVAAEVSGVMLTVDPVNGDPSAITIESAFGLGAPVVGGELTPDRHAIDKVTLEIRSCTIQRQPFADRLDPATGAVKRVPLNERQGAAPCLTDGEVLRLARLGRRVERELGGAVDMEWAMGPGPTGPRHLHLLQARPETVWSTKTVPIVQPRTTALDRIAAMMVGRPRSHGTRSET